MRPVAFDGTKRWVKRTLPPLGVGAFSPAHFLLALGMLFVATPFVDRSRTGELVEGLLLVIVMLTGILSVGGRRRDFVMALGITLPMLASKAIDHVWPGTTPAYITPIGGAVFSVFMVWQLIRYVMAATTITTGTICAGLATYIMLGLGWMFAYIALTRMTSGAFALFGQPTGELAPFDAFYFSFVTLTTAGYGDITPLSNPARMLSVLESLAGTFFIITILGRLVALYSQDATKTADGSR